MFEYLDSGPTRNTNPMEAGPSFAVPKKESLKLELFRMLVRARMQRKLDDTYPGKDFDLSQTSPFPVGFFDKVITRN